MRVRRRHLRVARRAGSRYAERMENQTPLLALTDCVVVRDGRPILFVDRLTLRAGESVAVLGPNGAGKSTLVRLLTRDVRPLAHEDGSPAVELLGRERWDLASARRIMGIVSDALQEDYDVAVSVRDAVISGFFGSIGLYHHQVVTPEMVERTDELLELLAIAHLCDRTMDTLSTGEARRTLIARALVHDPAVLVLDEPTDGLDPNAQWHVLHAMSDVARAGHAVVLVTHHVSDILPEITRVVTLKGGRVVGDGPKAHMLTSESLSDLFEVPVEIEERGGWYRLW
jgi:iron complex transport system ATP-binding protein